MKVKSKGNKIKVPTKDLFKIKLKSCWDPIQLHNIYIYILYLLDQFYRKRKIYTYMNKKMYIYMYLYFNMYTYSKRKENMLEKKEIIFE